MPSSAGLRADRRVSARLSRALHRWLRRESTLRPYERLARLHIYASAALDSNRIPTFNAVIGSRSTARPSHAVRFHRSDHAAAVTFDHLPVARCLLVRTHGIWRTYLPCARLSVYRTRTPEQKSHSVSRDFDNVLAQPTSRPWSWVRVLLVGSAGACHPPGASADVGADDGKRPGRRRRRPVPTWRINRFAYTVVDFGGFGGERPP
jgi:hypothetical protein